LLESEPVFIDPMAAPTPVAGVHSENRPVNGPVGLARVAWLVVVLACLVTALILLIGNRLGYAGVALAVAISAAINLR
jgi:hypothetical protein